jgi:sirohydrochlorin cobaltochelatase
MVESNRPSAAWKPALLPALLLGLLLAPGARAADAGPAEDHGDHVMTAEQAAELRRNVRRYATFTDQQIRDRMKFMPPDFQVYLSDPGLRGDVGVLLLAHGMGKEGNQVVQDAVKPVAAQWPLAVAFGMSMHHSAHLQAAVDRLTAAGAKTIVAVPTVVISDANTMSRQWEYLLGFRKEPAYASAPLVRTPARVLMAPAFDRHPLITGILADFAREISRNPAEEVVVLIGHGPERDEDNPADLAVLQHHGRLIREQGGFADVAAFNLQDDAPAPVRAANVARLREYVENRIEAGYQVLVVGMLMSTAGLQPKIRKDLEGLEFRFNEHGISAHPRFAEWVRSSVTDTLAGKAEP